MKIVEMYKKFKGTRFGKAFVRTQYRSFMLLLLSFTAAGIMEFMVQSARFGSLDLAARFPEMIQILRALSILTWFEQSLLWIRLVVTPKIDIQDLANKLQDSVNGTGGQAGTVVVYVTNNLMWLIRIILLYKLAGL